MKTPIEAKDIRKGDVVRCEMKDVAHEFRASCDRDNDGWAHPRFEWYLMHRPTPPVELPTEPTLGWATDEDSEPMLGVWRLRTDGTALSSLSLGITPDHVTAFTPAVGVPKAALDELRAAYVASNEVDYSPERAYDRGTAIDAFLAAVDEANR